MAEPADTLVISHKIESYYVSVDQNDYQPWHRIIKLALDSGDTAYIAFPEVRPDDWLQFVPGGTVLYMTADQFDDVYRLLQTEAPVYYTALLLFGFKVGSVHTELDLAAGEPPGEGEEDPQSLQGQSLEALIRLARAQG